MEKKLYIFLTFFWTFVTGVMLTAFLAEIPIPDWCSVLYAGLAAWYAAIIVSKTKD